VKQNVTEILLLDVVEFDFKLMLLAGYFNLI
jgi:hypothetical protein